MSLTDRIRAARQAHEALHAEPPHSANLPAKAKLYRDVKALLDELRAAADGPGVAGDPADVRRAIQLLAVDAEHHAGLNDSEGFRNPAEAWGQYEALERAFA